MIDTKSRNNAIMLQLSERIEGIKRSINAVTYNTVAELIQRVDEKSPVGDPEYWSPNSLPPPKGYIGGQFRGNWQLGVDQIPIEPLPGNIDSSGINTVAKNLAAIPQRAGYNKKYYLVNNLPYALRLEEGYSRQAPQGIISMVAIEFSSIVKGVVDDIKAAGGRVR